MGIAGGLVVQDGVTVEKGPPATVLPAEPYVPSLVQQGGIGQVLGKSPVTGLLSGCHQPAGVEDAGNARMCLEAFGEFELVEAEFRQYLQVYPRVGLVGPFAVGRETISPLSSASR